MTYFSTALERLGEEYTPGKHAENYHKVCINHTLGPCKQGREVFAQNTCYSIHSQHMRPGPASPANLARPARPARPSPARPGPARPDSARRGPAWPLQIGPAGPGQAGLGQAGPDQLRQLCEKSAA